MAKRTFLQLIFLMVTVVCFGQPVTITPPSATIEPGGSVTLTASGALYYMWSPATGLSTTEGPVTVASPMVTTTYTCSGYAPGLESVVNGNFDQGNVGFTSSYQYSSNLYGEGTYYVDSDASLHHPDFVGHGHGGTGNFMMVNGATSPGTNVWTEQISVQPNTNYAFSTWVCTLAGTSNEVAWLQFSINGQQLGEIFTAPANMNEWRQFYELWNSGNSTTATITILNQNTVGSGNDFGLDDVSFCEIVLVGAPQCTVTVNTMSAGNDLQRTCFGEAVEIPFLDNDQLMGSCNDFGCQIIQQAANGTATYDNSVMTYAPNTGFSGSDQFRYRITCGEHSAEATVFITVDPEFRETYTGTACDTFTWHGQHFTHSIDTTWTVENVAANGCDSIYELHLTVYYANEVTLNEVSICPNLLPYNFYGENYFGPVDVTVMDTDIHGCDSAVRLVLTINDYYIPPTEVVYRCYETTPSYTWNPIGDYEITYTADGFYTDTLPTEDCDGIFTLELHFMQIPEEEYYAPIVCDTYTWPVNGQTYTADCDDYFYESLDPFPCQLTYHLHLIVNTQEMLDTVYYNNGQCDSIPVHWFGQDTVFYASTVYTFTGETEDGCYREQTYCIEGMGYTPQPIIECANPNIQEPHYPITATEFNVQQYTYFVSDPVSDTSWLNSQCEWSISKESWLIIPSDDNRSCTVYAMDWMEDTVWLNYKAVNTCSGPDGVIAKYWLKPSFYGIGEQETSLPVVNIVPNPNNGQMEIRLERLTGKHVVKVFDMTGVKIDQFEINDHSENQTLQYDLQGHASGAYFFVVTGREGTVTKKVVVFN